MVSCSTSPPSSSSRPRPRLRHRGPLGFRQARLGADLRRLRPVRHRRRAAHPARHRAGVARARARLRVHGQGEPAQRARRCTRASTGIAVGPPELELRARPDRSLDPRGRCSIPPAPRGALRGATAASGRQAQARNRAASLLAGTPRRLLRLNRCGGSRIASTGCARGLARGPQSHPQGYAAASAGGLRQLRDLAATAAENAEYQTAHGATALARPSPCSSAEPCTPSLCPAGRLVGQGPATPAARRAVAIRPRSCSAARPSALTHPAHSAHCRPSTRLPHPEQCAYRPSGPNIEFA